MRVERTGQQNARCTQVGGGGSYVALVVLGLQARGDKGKAAPLTPQESPRPLRPYLPVAMAAQGLRYIYCVYRVKGDASLEAYIGSKALGSPHPPSPNKTTG